MLSLLLISALAVQYPSASKPATDTVTRAQPSATNRAAPVSRTAFHDAMRELWVDHVVYTRTFIVSAAAGLPDAGAVEQRLLRNQDEIANAIKPYYGDAAGNQLASLLRSHVQHAGRVVSAAKGSQKAMHGYGQDTSARMAPTYRAGDTTTMRRTDTTQIKTSSQYPTASGRDSFSVQSPVTDTAKAQLPGAQTNDPNAQSDAVAALRANADSIAAFLSQANPRNWSRATLQGALQMHINVLLQEATAHIKGDWTGSIAAFDGRLDQALQMADMLSDGIMKQFPNRFTNKATTMSSLQ